MIQKERLVFWEVIILVIVGGKKLIWTCVWFRMCTEIGLIESGDLTLLDFCLWCWIKSEVYKIKVDTRHKLLTRILGAALRYKPEGRGFDSRWCHWIFHWHNPFGRTMALGSTQPLTEMSTRNISWRVKGGRCVGLTTLPSCADCLEIWEPQPAGTLRACPGLYKDCFNFSAFAEDLLRPATRDLRTRVAKWHWGWRWGFWNIYCGLQQISDFGATNLLFKHKIKIKINSE